MTTVAIIGVTGYAGGHIADEALRRGHDVIGVSRSGNSKTHTGLTYRTGSLADKELINDLAAQASVLVIAVHAVEADQPVLLPYVPLLLDASSEHDCRLGIVGGAGSLRVSPDGPRLVDTPEFPDLYKAEALAHAEVLEVLRGSSSPADWFYVSPAAVFGSYAPGERTEKFRISGDVLLSDAEGNSFIGGEDFAIAFVDEIEKPTHHRARFAVAY